MPRLEPGPYSAEFAQRLEHIFGAMVHEQASDDEGLILLTALPNCVLMADGQGAKPERTISKTTIWDDPRPGDIPHAKGEYARVVHAFLDANKGGYITDGQRRYELKGRNGLKEIGARGDQQEGFSARPSAPETTVSPLALL